MKRQGEGEGQKEGEGGREGEEMEWRHGKDEEEEGDGIWLSQGWRRGCCYESCGGRKTARRLDPGEEIACPSLAAAAAAAAAVAAAVAVASYEVA